MGSNAEVMESDGPVAPQVQSQICPGATRSEFNCLQALDDTKIAAEDTNCNLTIMLSAQKMSSDEEGRTPAQLCSHFKEKLNLKGGQGVNGIVNGLSVNIDIPRAAEIEQKTASNEKTVKSEHSSSHCDKCENERRNSASTDSSTESNCVNSHEDSIGNSCENGEYKDGSMSDVTSEPGSGDVAYVSYKSELQMPDIMRLIQKDLSEPYSIYTYRYFIHNWPKLCFLAMDGSKCVGAIVCKLDVHRKVVKRGYIAMLAVDEKYRKRKIGSNLVLKAIRAMVEDEADEVVLETEITNRPALRLYENLGFVRDKRLFRYYLNGVDALRLKLWLR